MAKIGELIVELSADVAKFRGGMDDANSTLKDVSKNINDAGESVQGFVNKLNAVADLLIANKIVEFAKGVIESTAAIKEHADAIGLSTTAYQELQYAAQQTGVSSEDFDKAIRKLSVSIGQAEEGQKKLIAEFGAVGVSVQDLKSKTPDEIFEKVADGLKKIHDPAVASAESVALMGRGAAEMATLLRGGSSEIDKFRAEAEKLGIVIDQDTIKQAKEASDQLKTLGSVLAANATIILSVAVPAIKELADILGVAAEGAKAFREGGIAPDVSNLSQAQLQTGIKNIEETIAREKAKIADLGKSATDVSFLNLGFGPGRSTEDDPFVAENKVLVQLNLNLKTYKERLDELQHPTKVGGDDVPQVLAGSKTDEELKKFEELTAKLKEETAEEQQRAVAISQGKDTQIAFNEAVKVEKDVMSLGLKATQEHKDAIRALSTEMHTYEAAANKAAEAQKKIDEALKKANPSADELRKQLKSVEDEISTPLEKAQDKYIQQVQTLTEALDRDVISQDQYNQKLKEAQNALDQTSAAFKTSDLQESGKAAIGAIGNAFEEAVTSGKKLQDVLTSLGSELEKILLNALIFKPLENALSNGIAGSAGGGGLSGFLGGFGGSFSAGGTVGKDGAMIPIPRYDNGGLVGPDGGRIIVAHDGEFVLDRETVRRITGLARSSGSDAGHGGRPIYVTQNIETSNVDSFMQNRHQVSADLYRGIKTAGRFAS